MLQENRCVTTSMYLKSEFNKHVEHNLKMTLSRHKEGFYHAC